MPVDKQVILRQGIEKATLALLRSLQWSKTDTECYEQPTSVCPVCNAPWNGGYTNFYHYRATHHDDCELHQLIVLYEELLGE